MKSKISFSLKTLVVLSIFILTVSCGDDDVTDPGIIPAQNGYIITSFSETDPSTSFAGHFSEIPSGNLDLISNSQSFGFWRSRGMKDGYMFGPDDTDRSIMKKFAVDSETGVITAVDQIALDGQPSGVIFLDENTAVTGNFSQRTIQIFDPQSMTLTGSIDMSQAQNFPDNPNNYYSSLHYNDRTGKIFAVLYTDTPNTPQFYDAEAVYVEVIDAVSLTWEKTIVHQNAEYPIFRGETNTVIDESGNLYIIAQGQYGLDNMFGSQAPAGSRPQIIKINTNAEFDESYAFNPINELGFQNNFFQLFVSMVYGGNNKAYGIGTATTDDPQILVLLQKFATVGLTDEEYATLVNLVLYGEGMKVLEIDLISKAVREVNGIPLTAGFGYPFMYNYSGEIYTAITNSSSQSYYQINTANNSGSEMFRLTTGGFPYQLLDIANNQ